MIDLAGAAVWTALKPKAPDTTCLSAEECHDKLTIHTQQGHNDSLENFALRDFFREHPINISAYKDYQCIVMKSSTSLPENNFKLKSAKCNNIKHFFCLEKCELPSKYNLS